MILQVFGCTLEIFTPPFWSLCSFVRLLELLFFLCAHPTSFLSFCLIGLIGDGGGCCPERQTDRQAGRRPLAEFVKQSQSPSLAQLGLDHSGFRHLWKPALFCRHCLGLWLCQSDYVHTDCT